MRSSSMLPYFFARRGYLRTSALCSRCYTTSFVVLALLAPHPFCTSGDGDGDGRQRRRLRLAVPKKKKPVPARPSTLPQVLIPLWIL
jgi:hypothetical protein